MPRKKTTLTVGTAAIGLPYGLSNPVKQMPAEQAAAILDRCWDRGIERIETAAAYGDAEQRVGAWICNSGNNPSVISKAPPLTSLADDEVAEAINGFISQSLERLNAEMLDGYLLHHAKDWHREPVRRALKDAKENGVLKSVGLSGYDPKTILDLMALEPVDIIQAPVSLFDQSAEQAGLMRETVEKGVYLMARSIYLQGLLFMDPATLPAHLSAAAPALIALRRLAEETDLALAAMALHAALQTNGVGTAVLGFYAADQVDGTADAFAQVVDPAVLIEARRIAGGLPPEITDPRRWPSH